MSESVWNFQSDGRYRLRNIHFEVKVPRNVHIPIVRSFYNLICSRWSIEMNKIWRRLWCSWRNPLNPTIRHRIWLMVLRNRRPGQPNGLKYRSAGPRRVQKLGPRGATFSNWLRFDFICQHTACWKVPTFGCQSIRSSGTLRRLFGANKAVQVLHGPVHCSGIECAMATWFKLRRNTVHWVGHLATWQRWVKIYR